MIHSREWRAPSKLGVSRSSQSSQASALARSAGQRLVHFVGDRGGQLSHRRHTRDVSELRLRFAVSPLALSSSPSASLRSVKSSTKATPSISAFVERRRADQHRHTAAVLAEVLLLKWFASPGHLYLFNGPRVAVAPFRRRQIRPAHATGDEILAIVSHHVEKRVVGLNDATFQCQMKIPMMLDSTRRRTFASRSWRSL